MHHIIQRTTKYKYDGMVEETSTILFHNDRNLSVDELRQDFNSWAEQDSIIAEFGTQYWFPDYSTKIDVPGSIDSDQIASVNRCIEIIPKDN